MFFFRIEDPTPNATIIDVKIRSKQAPLALATTEGLTFSDSDNETPYNLIFSGNVFDVNQALWPLTHVRKSKYVDMDTIYVEIEGMGQKSYGGLVNTHAVCFEYQIPHKHSEDWNFGDKSQNTTQI